MTKISTPEKAPKTRSAQRTKKTTKRIKLEQLALSLW